VVELRSTDVPGSVLSWMMEAPPSEAGDRCEDAYRLAADDARFWSLASAVALVAAVVVALLSAALVSRSFVR
jgi:hypothetical protein